MNPGEWEKMYRLEDRHWWFVNRRRLVGEAMRRNFGSRGAPKILDVGCGTGSMLADLTRLGQVSGIDASPEAIDFCRRRGLAGVSQGQAQSLDFPDGSFTALTALDVLEHIDDDGRALREFRRVLAADGLLFVTVPAHRFLWSGHDEALGHLRRYGGREMGDKVRAAGFRVVYMTHFVTLLFPAIFLMRLAGRLSRRPPRSDLSAVSSPVNALLSGVCGLERFFLRLIRLPFGVSLFCVARPA